MKDTRRCLYWKQKNGLGSVSWGDAIPLHRIAPKMLFPLAAGRFVRLGSSHDEEARMSDKIARLGIERDNDLMYYIKNGDVWAVPRKQKGQPKGKPQKVAATGLDMDYSRYLYFLDGDGDVARKERSLGGGKRKAPKAVTSSSKAPKAAAAAAPAAKASGKKSDAQLDRDIEECLARVRKGDGADAASSSGKRKGRR